MITKTITAANPASFDAAIQANIALVDNGEPDAIVFLQHSASFRFVCQLIWADMPPEIVAQNG